MPRDPRTLLPGLLHRFRDVLGRLSTVRVVESSVVLAAQAFLALFPLVLVAYAYLPAGAAEGLLDQMRGRFGLSGESSDAMGRLVGARDSVRESLSAAGFLIVLGSATSFTRALQRVYERAWGLDKLSGLRGVWRWVAWVLGVVVYLSIIGWLVHVIRNGGITTPLSAVIGIGIWWWTGFLLLGGRVRPRALVPGAVLTAAAQVVATLIGTVYLPRSVRSNESNYGPIGTVFAIESWFIVIAGIIVVGAVLGAVLGSGDNAFARWVNGSAEPDAWRRQPHLPRRRPASHTSTKAGPDLVAEPDRTEA